MDDVILSFQHIHVLSHYLVAPTYFLAVIVLTISSESERHREKREKDWDAIYTYIPAIGLINIQ